MTMQRDLQCPNCDGREIWRIETMHERDESLQPKPMGVRLEPRMFRGLENHGKFETLICKKCGYTEWYAKAIGFLKSDPVNGVHLIKNDIDKEGPYR